MAIELPDLVRVIGLDGDRDVSYPLSKGTWFINTAPATVSADLYDSKTTSVDTEAVLAHASGVTRIDSRYGKPYRMYSQSSFDRVYSTQGDIQKNESIAVLRLE